MELNIQITSFSVDIKPAVREDNIKAFVTWIFQTSVGEWKIYGGTIRQKPFGKNQKLLLTYDPPAIGKKFFKAFYIGDKELYKKLCKHTIEEYCKITGEVGNNFLVANEDVKEDEIPID